MRAETSAFGQVKRLRFLTSHFQVTDRKPEEKAASEVTFLPMEAIGEQGQLDLSQTRPVEEVQTGYSMFHDGDVVVAKITPCFENGKGALIRGTLNGFGYGTTELHVITPGPDLVGRFLYYATVQPLFRRIGEASMTGAAGQQRVPEDFVRDFRISLPSLSQQHAIADYLDRETARIDALIAAKERVLELLAEKRQALITRAVTCGLNANAVLRDSGVPWLGKIPVHWEIRRVAWLFRERDQRGVPELPLLEVSINNGVVLREFSDERIESTAADFNMYKVARCGDVVFNKMRMWQGAVGVAPQDGLVSPDYVVAEPMGPLTSAYAGVLFRTPTFSAECARRSHGIVWDRLRLYWEGFRDINVPLPPLKEQSQLVATVNSKTAELDRLSVSIERSAGLLRERRGALIAAAVAGQIDVKTGTSTVLGESRGAL